MKKRFWRNSVLIPLVMVMGFCGQGLATTNASITISSTGTPVSAPGSITVAFSDSTGHNYSETVPYGVYSSPASLAAWLGAKFTSSYLCPSAGSCTSGLGAQVITPGSGTVTFQLNNGANFGSITITNPSDSFTFNPSGWPPTLSTPTLSVASSGTPSLYGGLVTLTATISSGPTGSVTFYDGSSVIGTGTINGTTATFTTSTLALGIHTISVSWTGNANYSSVTSSSITQTVTSTLTTCW